MNDLIKYHDDDPVIEQNIVNFESSSDTYGENTSSLIQGILRRWRIVLLVFLLISAIGIPAVWLTVKPLYVVTGAIKVDPILENIVTGEAEKGEISNYQTFMNTQAIQITSNQIVQRVADDLADKNLSFFEYEPTDPFTKIKEKLFGPRINLDHASILKQAINDGIITVTPLKSTELITITMKSQNPQEARQIVDAFIKSYTNLEGSGSTQEQNRKLNLLEEQRANLAIKLKDHRDKIRSLAQEYGTTSPADEKELLRQRQRISMLYTELAKLESRKITLETQKTLLLKSPQQGLEPEEMLRIRNEYINSNPRIQGLTGTIIQLERDLIIAQQELSPENPALKQKQDTIDIFQLRLKEERQAVAEEFDLMASKEAQNTNKMKLQAVETELEQTLEHKKRLEQFLEDVDIEMVKVGNTQLDIEEFKFQLEQDKERYDKIARRIYEIEMQRKRPARIEVANPADIGPMLNERMKYIMAVLFGALACGLLLAFIINKADLRLQTPEDVSKQIGLRIIGTTTSSHNIKPYLLPEQIAGDYQTIRTNLGLITDEGVPRKLVVTSPGMREGKTTFSVNLASSMAKSGKKVLLIDGDLRKPDIAKMLGIPEGSRSGLQDVLLGEEFDNAIYTVPATGLDVLIADSQSRINGYELLASPGTRQCIDMLSQHYDHIIIDTTPILAFPDTLIWATLGDAVILVSYAGHTTTPDLKEAKERLTRINVKVLGTVLSNVPTEHSYFRSDLKRYIENSKSKGTVRRGKRTPIVDLQTVEEHPDNVSGPEPNRQVED